MVRNGILWRLQRGPERFEAVVFQRPNGQCELQYVRNGAMQQNLKLAQGRALPAFEDAVRQREALKADGWSECGDRAEPLQRPA